MMVHATAGGQPQGCLGELQEASTRLDKEGFWWRPSWPELLHGKRPPQCKMGSQASGNTGGSTGLFHFRAFFRKTQILLRSHSGRNAGAALAQHPQLREHVIPSHLFRTLCWRRCSCLSCSTRRGCQSSLDVLGDIERRVRTQAGSNNGPFPSTAFWPESAERLGRESGSTHSCGT